MRFITTDIDIGLASVAIMKTESKVQKSKVVPPDGGYGFVVLFAASVNFTATTMFAVCFGLIFSDFLKEIGMGSTAVSVLAGINAVCVAVSAFLTGPLLKIMSRRKLALVGSVFFNLGSIGTVFVNTQAQLIFCQGLLQNFGIGFLYNVSYTALNDYFVDKRMFSVSILNTLTALAGMVAPNVISWSMAEYGFRGTLVVISAISLQTFVASALLQPVAWHMKEVVEDDQDKKLLSEIEKSINELENKVPETPVIKLNNMENAEDLFPEKKVETDKLSNPNGVITWLNNFLDWPLFKKFFLTCSCLGAAVILFAEITTVFFLAQFLYNLNWNNAQVAWAFSLLGFGDIATRILMIFFSSCFHRLENHPTYVAGIFLAIITRLGLLWVTDYAWTLAIITVMGVSRCIIIVLYPLVVSDSVEPEEFASAMGINFMVYGIISIIMGPVVGAIRDMTGNYTIMFLILTALMIATAAVWIVELLRNRKKLAHKRS